MYSPILLLLFSLSLIPTASYTPQSPSPRRTFLATATLTTTSLLYPTTSLASGGATAGGAYLLSAKQRYNERCISGVKEYAKLSSIDELKVWYKLDDVGGWGNFKASGYLLSNAFRRSSSTPPEKLPAVKKWRVFEGAVEGMGKKGKKGGTLEEGLAALDEWIREVELGDGIKGI